MDEMEKQMIEEEKQRNMMATLDALHELTNAMRKERIREEKREKRLLIAAIVAIAVLLAGMFALIYFPSR